MSPYTLCCEHLLSLSVSTVQTHLSFGREFTEAVEMKQVAQQEAERARFLVEKVSYNSLLAHCLHEH